MARILATTGVSLMTDDLTWITRWLTALAQRGLLSPVGQ